MSLRDGVNRAFSQEPVQEHDSAQENILANGKAQHIKDKCNVFVCGEEFLPHSFETLMHFDALYEENPA